MDAPYLFFLILIFPHQNPKMPNYSKPFLKQVAKCIVEDEFEESFGISCARALARDDHELAHEIAPRLRGIPITGWKIRKATWIQPWFTVLDHATLVRSSDGKLYDPSAHGSGLFLQDRSTPHDRANEVGWSSIIISSRVFEASWNTFPSWEPVFIASRDKDAPFNYSRDPSFAHQKTVLDMESAQKFAAAQGLKGTVRNLMSTTNINFTTEELRRNAIRREAPRLISNFVGQVAVRQDA